MTDDLDLSASGNNSLEGSLLSWINTFIRQEQEEDNQSQHYFIRQSVTQLEDLSDAVVLYQVMQVIDPEHFDFDGAQLNKVNDQNTNNDNTQNDDNNTSDDEKAKNELSVSEKLSNIKKLIQALQQSLDDYNPFQREHDNKLQLSQLTNVSAIANKERGELVKLLEFVLVAAVNSPQKDVAVENIMSLNEQEQHQLMYIIQETLERFTPQQASQQSSSGHNVATHRSSFNTPSPSHSPRTSTRLQVPSLHLDDEQISKLRSQVADLQKENDDYKTRLGTLNQENRDLKRDNHELSEQLHEMKEKLSHDIEDAKAQATKAVEDAKKQEAQKNNRALNEARAKQQELETEVSNMKQQLDSQKRKLQEELDNAKSETKKLRDELEVANDKAKQLIVVEKTLDRYKEKLSEMGNVNLRVKELEDQHRQDLERITELETISSQADSLREQFKKQKEETKALQYKLEEAETNAQDNNIQLNVAKEMHEQKVKEIQTLEQEIATLKADIKIMKDENLTMTPAARSRDQPIFSPNLEEKIIKLEKENAALRATAPQSEENKLLLEEIESMKRKYESMVAKHTESHKQVLQLTHQLNVAKQSVDPTQQDQFVNNIVQENANLNEKLKELQSKLDAANTAAVVASAVAAATATTTNTKSTKTTKEVKKKVGEKSREELLEENKKLRDLVIRYKKEITKTKQAPEGVKYEETVKALQKQLSDAKQENTILKQLRQELKESSKLEQELMSSAFYELGTELQMFAHVFGRDTQGSATGANPHRSSWLNRQRSRLNR